MLANCKKKNRTSLKDFDSFGKTPNSNNLSVLVYNRNLGGQYIVSAWKKLSKSTRKIHLTQHDRKKNKILNSSRGRVRRAERYCCWFTSWHEEFSKLVLLVLFENTYHWMESELNSSPWISQLNLKFPAKLHPSSNLQFLTSRCLSVRALVSSLSFFSSLFSSFSHSTGHFTFQPWLRKNLEETSFCHSIGFEINRKDCL